MPERRSPRLRPEDLSFEAVARISTQVELSSLRLRFLHADWTDADGPIPPDWTADAVMGFVADGVLDRGVGRLKVECGFLAVYAPGVDTAVQGMPNPKDAPVELHARFELIYDVRDDSAILDSDPEHFALANGILHAWPYWREVAHNTTVRMGLAPLLVGTVKIPWSGDPAPNSSDEPD